MMTAFDLISLLQTYKKDAPVFIHNSVPETYDEKGHVSKYKDERYIITGTSHQHLTIDNRVSECHLTAWEG